MARKPARDPMLIIRLEKPGYFVGDTLRATVLLSNLEEAPRLNNDGLSVFFEGRAKTKIVVSHSESSTTYRARAPLLKIENTCRATKESAASADRREWRVSVDLPRCVQNIDVMKSRPFADNGKGKSKGYWSTFTAADDFNTHPNQALPPTWTSWDRGSGGYIRYTLTVMATVAGTVCKASTQVVVMSARVPALLSTALTNDREWLVKTLHLLLDHPPGTKLTIKEGMKDFFQTRSVPELRCRTRATQPREAALGRPLLVTCTVKPEFERSSILHDVPDIRLSAVRARVRAKANRRACGLSRTRSHNKEVWRRVSNFADGPRVFHKGNSWTISVSTGNLASTVPDFQTYNVSVSHSLAVTWDIECAGRKEKIKSVGWVRVYSGVENPGVEDGADVQVESSTGSLSRSVDNKAPITSEKAEMVEDEAAEEDDDLESEGLPSYEEALIK